MNKHSIKKSSKFKYALVIIKLIVLVVTALFIYYKLKDTTNFGDSFIDQLKLLKEKNNLLLLFTAIILMPLNWLLEAVKWKQLVSKTHQISIIQSFKGVLLGLSLGFITPHAIGDYAGRIWSIKGQNKFNLIGSVWLGKVLQMTVTGLFGIIGVVVFYNNSDVDVPWAWITIVCIVSIVLARVLYNFLKGKASGWIKRIQNYFKIVLTYSWKEVGGVFLISILRYLVFSAQFLLVLFAMQIKLPLLKLFAGVTWVFLLKSIIPSFNFMSDLGIRELSALTFFDLYKVDQSAVISASLIVWLVNILMPVLVGLILVMQLKRK